MQAAYGLRKAAEAEFTGNAYYQIAHEIDGLIETLGGNEGGVTPGQGAAYGFATMIDEVRRLAKARTEGNQYYSIVVKLDRLESHMIPAAPVSEQPTAPAPATAPAAAPVTAPASAPVHTPSPARPTFDDLAAASKARVEVVAAGLDIVPAHHVAPPHHEVPDVLEKRSSEPCSMAELAPVAEEQVAAAEAAALPADHVHDGAGDGAKCPFHAMLADTAEETAAEPAPAPAAVAAEAAAAPLPADHSHHTAGGDGPAKCPFHEPPGAPAPAQELPAPASAEKVASFDELAAASKAQVEHVAAGLGVEVAHPGTPIQAEAVEAPGERRLESRSSEGVERVLESVEPTVVAAETAPEPRGQEAAPDLGSPAAQGEAPAVEEAVIVVEEAVIVEVAAAAPAVAAEPAPADAAPDLVEPAAKAEVLAVEEAVIVEVAAATPAVAPEPASAEAAPVLAEPAAQGQALAAEEAVIVEVATPCRTAGGCPAPEPAPEAAAVAPVQKIEVKPAEPKQKEPKTLFKLWLDLAFGRKD